MRSDAYVIVTCDRCGTEEQIQLTALAHSGSWGERNVSAALDLLGWVTDGDKDICDTCNEEPEEDGEEEE